MPKAITNYIVAVATVGVRQRIRMIRCAIKALPDEALRAKCHIAAMQTLRDQVMAELHHAVVVAEREEAARFPPTLDKTAPAFAPALEFLNGKWNREMRDALLDAVIEEGWEVGDVLTAEQADLEKERV